MTSTDLCRVAERRPAPAFELGGALAEQRARLLEWLDAGLRAGRRGRLAAELALALDAAGDDDHVVAWIDAAPASHALVKRVEVEAAGARVTLGMIGLVYTEPGWRGLGLASACVEEALRRLAAGGAHVAALWSERDSFYARLGFAPAGRELLLPLDAAACRRARETLAGHAVVGAPRESDWPALEALYVAKPCRTRRAAGALARAARAPECRLLVAREDERPLAYAALGRGDDFRGVAHEWAGAPAGVLACLERWTREGLDVTLLAGSLDEEPVPALRAAGVTALPRPFAQLRLLDASGLWSRIVAGSPALATFALAPADAGGFLFGDTRTRARLRSAEALALLFGPRPPAAALTLLGPRQRTALAERLPWPLFVWGFDSI